MPTPTSSSPWGTVQASSVSHIDALVGGSKWGSSAVGSAMTISYSFPTTGSSWATSSGDGYGPSSGDGEPWQSDYSTLNAAQRSAFRTALATWADVANLTFVETTDTPSTVGDIRVAFSGIVDTEGAAAWAYYPDAGVTGGDVWINPYSPGNLTPAPGNYGFSTLVHELGHALGLKHPFEGAVVLPTATDTLQYSIMSYTGHPTATIEPSGPMLYDIAAIQYIYGANMQTRTGNDTYTVSAVAEEVRAIWDAGGTDTLDASNQSLAVTIDLHAGAFSSIGLRNDGRPAEGNLAIAFGTTIEDAVGGSGNDILTGNEANNILIGGPGRDTAVYAGQRADYTITGNATNATVARTGEGTDTVQGVERLHFTDGTLVIDPSDPASSVFRLYRGSLTRDPDLPGMQYWTAQADAGMALRDIAGSFIASGEFQSRFGTDLSNTAFATLLYQTVLQRTADIAGLDYWTAVLDHGMARADVLLGFSDSAENLARTSSLTRDWIWIG